MQSMILRQPGAARGAHPRCSRRLHKHVLAPCAAELVRPQPPPAAVDPWARVQDALYSGSAVEGTICQATKGGVLVDLGTIKGYIPYSKLSPSRLRPGHQGNLGYLVGQTVKARVVQVDVSGARKELVLSEKLAAWTNDVAALGLAVGAAVIGRVTHLEDYGAFVQLLGQGGELTSISGFCHISELSWDKILTPDQVVAKGQLVAAKVVDVDIARCRVTLSLRQTQADPLQQTLDSLTWVAAEGPLPEVAPLLEALSREGGIQSVAVGRRAEEKRVVAQDLELYLTKEEAGGSGNGFTLVARSGRSLQELQVVTSMSRDAMKKALTRVLSRAREQ